MSILFCALGSVLLTGCVNLDEVTQLSKLADQARTSLPSIAIDLKGSCERQNSYVISQAGQPPVKPCLNAEDLGKLGDNLVVEQDVLLDYFDALGKLASNSPLAYQSTVAGLATSFQTAGLTDSQAQVASAAGSLAAAIAELALHGYREREVSRIIQKTDSDVQKLANGLANQINGDSTVSYRLLLSNEELLMSNYYDVPLAKPGADSLVSILVRRQYEGDVEHLNAHREAAHAYQLLMIALAKAHATLKTESADGHIDAKQLRKALEPALVQIATAITDLHTNLR